LVEIVQNLIIPLTDVLIHAPHPHTPIPTQPPLPATLAAAYRRPLCVGTVGHTTYTPIKSCQAGCFGEPLGTNQSERRAAGRVPGYAFHTDTKCMM